MLSVLAGHKRYAHVTALRADGVLPELLGIERILSEDAVRRGLAAIDEAAGTAWLRRHLDHCSEPLLGEGWVLDADTTIKPLYGHLEGAVLGYNPKKPGRPSHTYHSFFLSNLRLVLDVEVMAGNQHAANHAAPGLWALLKRIGRDRWPRLLRADKGFASDALMSACEEEGLPYLMRLRLTKNVTRAIERLAGRGGWQDAGQGWQGIDTPLKLSGWAKARRMVLLRRRVASEPNTDRAVGNPDQLRLSFATVADGGEVWEHAALVTSLGEHNPRIPDDTIALMRELTRLMPDRQIARLLNRIGVETGYGNAWTQERVRGFRHHHEIAGHRDGEWAERGEITLEAAAKIVGVCNMTALRMLRRGDIKGRQVCPGAPWAIKAAESGRICWAEAIRPSANTKSRPAGL